MGRAGPWRKLPRLGKPGRGDQLPGEEMLKLKPCMDACPLPTMFLKPLVFLRAAGEDIKQQGKGKRSLPLRGFLWHFLVIMTVVALTENFALCFFSTPGLRPWRCVCTSEGASCHICSFTSGPEFYLVLASLVGGVCEGREPGSHRLRLSLPLNLPLSSGISHGQGPE